MQKHSLLLVLTLVAAAVAGCAENGGTGGDANDTTGNGTTSGTPASPPAAMTNAQALALFSQAASDVPDKYGVDMVASKDGKDLMDAEAVFDERAQTGFFRMTFDESLMEESSGDMGGEMFADAAEIVMYTSPQGNAILMNGTVMVTPPDEDSPFSQGAQDAEGFEALSDPTALLSELEESNISITSVTPTTLRGKAAYRIEATFVEEGETQNTTMWLFQSPARVGRIEMLVPNATDDEDPFAGAKMTMDMLYDAEVQLTVPSGITRALGLRYESDRESFGGFGGGSDEGPEVWTFQVDGDVAIGEVLVEVGDAESMGEEMTAAWSMPLSAKTKSQDGVTLTFNDADADGKVSANDTLTIGRSDDAGFAQVWLKDTVSGYRIVPGAGLFVALAAIGVALLALRRR